MSDAKDHAGIPTLERLCAEMIALRERNDRQHKLFEQSLAKSREDWSAAFSAFAADVHHAYQQLRDAMTGEKRQSLGLTTMLLEVALDLDRLASSRPGAADAALSAAWADGVGVAARKAQGTLAQLGIHRFDAHFGDEYQPALHERTGSEKVEGLAPMRVARQLEPGYASSAPDFVIRRARVLVSE